MRRKEGEEGGGGVRSKETLTRKENLEKKKNRKRRQQPQNEKIKKNHKYITPPNHDPGDKIQRFNERRRGRRRHRAARSEGWWCWRWVDELASLANISCSQSGDEEHSRWERRSVALLHEACQGENGEGEVEICLIVSFLVSVL